MCLFPHLVSEVQMRVSAQDPSSTDPPQLQEERKFRNSLVFCATSITLSQLLQHSHTDRQWDLFVQKACSQEEHVLSNSNRENNCRRTLLDCARSKPKCFIVGHHFHTSRVPLQLISSFSNQRVPARVRAHAVSFTPLVVAHRSLPYDKKVMGRN